MNIIKKFESTLCLIVLIVILTGSIGMGCTETPEFPAIPDWVANLVKGIATLYKAITDPNTPNSGGQPGVDPVLLKTGEFLLTRKDAVLDGCGVDFPIIRTYRSQPAPVNKHRIGDDLGVLGGPDGPGSQGNYNWVKMAGLKNCFAGSPPYSDWIAWTWMDYPPDDYYKFRHSITTSPGIITEAVDEDDRIGFRFRIPLWTGLTYNVHLTIERYDPDWEYVMPNPICGNPGGCEPAFDIYPCLYACPGEWTTILDTQTYFVTSLFPDGPKYSRGYTPTNTHSPLYGGASNELVVEEFEEDEYTCRLNWSPGWDMSYNKYLIDYADPNLEDGEDEPQIHLYTGDGNVWVYKSSETPHPIYGTVWRCDKRYDVIKKWSTGDYTLYINDYEYWNFGPEGYIDSQTKNGKVITFNYSSACYGLYDKKRLESIEDYLGRKIRLIYTDSDGIYPGNLSKIIDHRGREWFYDYYADGNLKSVTDPNGFVCDPNEFPIDPNDPDILSRETYYYTLQGNLEKIEDTDRQTWLENEYDNFGRVYSQTWGNTTSTISYDSENQSTVTDSEDIETIYTLNDDGYLLQVEAETDTGTATTVYQRNPANQITKIIYPEQNGYDLAYDTNGNLTVFSAVSSDPEDPNLTYTLTYQGSNDIKTITGPRGNTTTYTYDYEDPQTENACGLLTKITYPEVMTDQGRQVPEVRFTYTSYNQVETVTSPEGIVIRYEYLNEPNVPGGDPNAILGRLSRVILDYGTDPNYLNIVYEMTCDSTGRVVDVNCPEGYKATLTYNDLNLLTKIKNPAGQITRLFYNGDRKVTKIQRQFRDGWQEFEYGYNVLSKLQTITDSLGRTTTYNYDGRNLVGSITDPNNHTTEKKYNARQLLKELINAEDNSTTFEYDDNERLITATDAEDADTEYEYDGYGRLEFVRYADQSFEQYDYDESGNITSFTNRADETILFGYDELDRLAWKQRPSEPNIILTCDLGGRLVDVTQDSEQMIIDYDRLGRLTETTDQNGYQVGYEYDKLGRRTKLVYPDDTWITYEYDSAGNLEYIKDQYGDTIVRYFYDELSRTTDVQYYNSSNYVGSIAYDYEDRSEEGDDLGNRIEKIDYCCNPEHSISYTYDKVGNMTAMDVGNTNYNWAYGYDGIYQLLTADRGQTPNRMIDYEYDSVYNRTYWNDSHVGSLTYTDNALNQYTAVGSTTPTYDNRGNCVNFGSGAACTYDCENRLTEVYSGMYFTVIEYEYDPLSRRISRTCNSSTTTYVWDGAQIIAEYVNGSLARKYIYGPGMDNPTVMISEANWYYYYADALGSVRLLTNSSGTIVESYTYDPYGRPRVMASTGADGNWLTEDTIRDTGSFIGNPYMFTGRRWDYQTELYYYRMRDYSPNLGRFMQTDPAGYIDGMNLYAYVGNNPLNWIDPLGLVTIGIGESGEAGAILGGGIGYLRVIDDEGNYGIYLYGQYPTVLGITASDTGSVGFFGGNIQDLNGITGNMGASGGAFGAVGGIDTYSNGAENLFGVVVNLGGGAGTIVEIHGGICNGILIPQGNIYEDALELIGFIEETIDKAIEAIVNFFSNPPTKSEPQE